MDSTDTDQAMIEILEDASGTKGREFDEVIPLVYDELKKLAHGYLRGEPTTQTLQTTALVHEVYLKLVGRRHLRIGSRVQFFALAGHIMRRLLMDYGRKRRADKRIGKELKVPISAALELPDRAGLDLFTLVILDDAILGLEAIDPQLAKIVVLRFYSGLSNSEIAEYLEVSLSTVRRSWVTAKQWLAHELSTEQSGDE